MLSSAPPQGRNHPNSGLNVEILDFIGVILSNQNAAEHHALLRRLLAFLQVVIQIGDALSGDGLLQNLSVSIGGAIHAGPAAFRDLFRSADDRLYSAKQGGRNQITLPEAA